ncbi:MAG: cysteine desulfurase [Ignavibacteria bacterium]|nr:cysteine desulfurase [Ignavibacteria bacterium]
MNSTTVKKGVRDATVSRFDPGTVRSDFPALSVTVKGKPLVYLDNAATTHKPASVIEAITQFYSAENSNVHRGVHHLSELATEKFEESRRKVQRFLNATESSEIIFVRGTTEGINLAAQSYGGTVLRNGDNVVISAMEHHSNIVPWQIVCDRVGASLRVIPINRKGELLQEEFERLLDERTKIVALTHISNALGTVNPVQEMIRTAHDRKIPVLIDGAQAVAHGHVDVQELDCDFYAFSSHKMFGPTGIGVLYGKKELLESMPPYQGGGDMIKSVSFSKTMYADLPHKFEAGTPHIAGAIGLGAAIDYIGELAMEEVALHERRLVQDLTDALTDLPGVQIIGTATNKAGVVSFTIDGIHPHDIGTILNEDGIAVRTGQHCAQPVMDFFGIPATARASVALYNTTKDIQDLVAGVRHVQKVFH